MAMLEKIFSNRRQLIHDYLDSRNRVRSCEKALEQVRLLLYKECDRRGRKVLFDSSTIERVPASKNDKPNFRDTGKVPCIVEVTEGFTYIYKGAAGDAGVLGEMIFGAVAMNCKGVSLKIHIMNDPKRLMCTKLFSVPPSRRISQNCQGDRKISEVKSCGDLNSSPRLLSLPQLREEGVSLSFSLDRGDSGFYGEQSPYSSVGSTCEYFSMFDTWEHNSTDDYCLYTPTHKLSCSSSGSWQRRSSQSAATRFDFSGSSLRVPSSVTVHSADSQLYSNSSASGTSDSLASSTVSNRRGKLGLALLISVAESVDMDLVRRCMEHSPQLQALVCRLRLAALAAGAGNAFVSDLHRATEDAARWLSDLMCGPRLHSVWLDLACSGPEHTNKMAANLLTDFCSVLSVADTKETNFFISTLLTNVLTHHLGWVATVSPYDAAVDQSTPEPTDSRRPYNALWAQLTDLCGGVGFPPRSARTIIAGSKNLQFVNRLLAVLTYFIRCGDVKKNDFQYQDCAFSDAKVKVIASESDRTAKSLEVKECTRDSLRVPSFDRSSGSSVSTLVPSEGGMKKSTTLANLSREHSSSAMDGGSSVEIRPKPLRRQATVMISLKDSSDSGSELSASAESENRVLFVLGDDEKLVGLKNKSNGGKCVKKSSKAPDELVDFESTENVDACTVVQEKEKSSRSTDSPSKCCAQTLQHSKPIKHSGFKFEFDKYPQIVTNYMKSKNLEILDRHYIGKPGNLKLDNFQFDPTFVPPIQEERCEACYKCQLMESMLQTPTNASEMEYMNDMPRQTEPQFAREVTVEEAQAHRELSPKTFVRKRKENTVVVNVRSKVDVSASIVKAEGERAAEKDDKLEVKRVIEFPLPQMRTRLRAQVRSGYDVTLLGGVTDHYVPDLVLQGTSASPGAWEAELRRDLDLSSYLHKSVDAPAQAVAIVGDTNKWEVRVVGRAHGSGGLSPLVGGMLDALAAMRGARVPPQQCLLYLESKLREFCVLSKTLADMLMSTDFCDIATLTRSLSIDVNDVPLLLAIATTHTPQVARRYGISYR